MIGNLLPDGRGKQILTALAHLSPGSVISAIKAMQAQVGDEKLS
jgi:hypothetical protein